MRAAGSDWEVVGVNVTGRFMKFVVVVNCGEMGSDMSAANQQRLRCSRLAVENKIGFHRCLLCNVLYSFTLFEAGAGASSQQAWAPERKAAEKNRPGRNRRVQ